MYLAIMVGEAGAEIALTSLGELMEKLENAPADGIPIFTTFLPTKNPEHPSIPLRVVVRKNIYPGEENAS